MLKRTLPIILAVFVAVTAGSANAIDFNDLLQLKRSGVQDQVIVNLVQANKLPVPLTTSQILALNAAGASPSLLDFLTRPESSYAQAAIVSDPDCYTGDCGATDYVEYVESAPTYIVQEPSPTIIVETPVYYESPTYYYDYSPSYYGSYSYNRPRRPHAAPPPRRPSRPDHRPSGPSSRPGRPNSGQKPPAGPGARPPGPGIRAPSKGSSGRSSGIAAPAPGKRPDSRKRPEAPKRPDSGGPSQRQRR